MNDRKTEGIAVRGMQANVLLLGASGVGKSTLINAIRGKDLMDRDFAGAGPGSGGIGYTREVQEYPCEGLGISLIDTVGFEPDPGRRQKAIRMVRKWTRDGIAKGDDRRSIDAVWFCVDGTTRRLFHDVVRAMVKSVRLWRGVPVIVVITKSYSLQEQEENRQMVLDVFLKQKHPVNLKAIVPVVAMPYAINEEIIVPSQGLEKLIDATLEAIPEGKRAKAQAISRYKLNRKRVWAQSIVVACTGSAATIGAVPVPFADGAILGPLEAAEIRAIARVYGIPKSKDSDSIVRILVEMGTAGAVAKTIISGMKAIPGINIAAEVLNAVVAGSIVAAIGEGSCRVFEEIYLGNRKASDVEWIRKIMEQALTKSAAQKTQILADVLARSGRIGSADVLKLVKAVFIDGKTK